jgi:spore coat polysaccharide biosynthesis predicted glycosyltransferase SpsG
MINKDLRIVIFTEFSKKIGAGHYVRSKRLYNFLKKKYSTFIYINKKNFFIKKFVNNNFSKTIFIFDFKNYKNHIYKKKNFCHYIYFDRISKKKKFITNVNPLIPSNKILTGPKWFAYPSIFFSLNKVKKNKKIKRLLICQGGTDANNNIIKLMKIIKNKIKDLEFELSVLVPENFSINKNLQKKYSIKIYSNVQKISQFLNRFDHIVTSCGNISFEINFFGLSCTYVTSELREINLAKFLEKKSFGRYFKISQKQSILNDIYDNLRKKITKYRYQKKIRYFRHDGLNNFLKLILKIKNEI